MTRRLLLNSGRDTVDLSCLIMAQLAYEQTDLAACSNSAVHVTLLHPLPCLMIRPPFRPYFPQIRRFSRLLVRTSYCRRLFPTPCPGIILREAALHWTRSGSPAHRLMRRSTYMLSPSRRLPPGHRVSSSLCKHGSAP